MYLFADACLTWLSRAQSYNEASTAANGEARDSTSSRLVALRTRSVLVVLMSMRRLRLIIWLPNRNVLWASSC
jgi:hypothetical protein